MFPSLQALAPPPHRERLLSKASLFSDKVTAVLNLDSSGLSKRTEELNAAIASFLAFPPDTSVDYGGDYSCGTVAGGFANEFRNSLDEIEHLFDSLRTTFTGHDPEIPSEMKRREEPKDDRPKIQRKRLPSPKHSDDDCHYARKTRCSSSKERSRFHVPPTSPMLILRPKSALERSSTLPPARPCSSMEFHQSHTQSVLERKEVIDDDFIRRTIETEQTYEKKASKALYLKENRKRLELDSRRNEWMKIVVWMAAASRSMRSINDIREATFSKTREERSWLTLNTKFLSYVRLWQSLRWYGRVIKYKKSVYRCVARWRINLRRIFVKRIVRIMKEYSKIMGIRTAISRLCRAVRLLGRAWKSYSRMVPARMALLTKQWVVYETDCARELNVDKAFLHDAGEVYRNIRTEVQRDFLRRKWQRHGQLMASFVQWKKGKQQDPRPDTEENESVQMSITRKMQQPKLKRLIGRDEIRSLITKAIEQTKIKVEGAGDLQPPERDEEPKTIRDGAPAPKKMRVLERSPVELYITNLKSAIEEAEALAEKAENERREAERKQASLRQAEKKRIAIDVSLLDKIIPPITSCPDSLLLKRQNVQRRLDGHDLDAPSTKKPSQDLNLGSPDKSDSYRNGDISSVGGGFSLGGVTSSSSAGGLSLSESRGGLGLGSVPPPTGAFSFLEQSSSSSSSPFAFGQAATSSTGGFALAESSSLSGKSATAPAAGGFSFGSSSSSTSGGQSSGSSSSSTGGFSFGQSSSSTGGFSFGQSSSSTGGFSFGQSSSSTGGFSFGQPSSSSTSGAQSSSSSTGGFSFGQSSSSSTGGFSFEQSSSSTGGFSFGQSSSSTGGFSFGQSSSSTGGFSFGQSSSSTGGSSFEQSSSSTGGFSFGQSSPSSTSGGQSSSTGAFSFGQSSSSSTGAFSFGQSSSSSTGGFSFGQSSSSSTGGFSFGQSSSSSTGGFSFGQSSSSSSSGVFAFGSTSSSASESAGGAFTFGVTPPPISLTFGGSSSSVASSFGGFGQSSSSNAPGFSFGQSSSSSNPFNFGQSASSSAAGFNFGQSSSQSSTPFMFGFGGASSSSTGTFAFGQSSSSANSFSFGGASSSGGNPFAAASSTPFSFGASSSSSQSPFTGFGGQSSNPFGSSSTTSGFNFGSAGADGQMQMDPGSSGGGSLSSSWNNAESGNSFAGVSAGSGESLFNLGSSNQKRKKFNVKR